MKCKPLNIFAMGWCLAFALVAFSNHNYGTVMIDVALAILNLWCCFTIGEMKE